MQVNKIIQAVKKNGGLTLNATGTVFRPKSGYMISLLGYETQCSLTDVNAIAERLEAYTAMIKKMLSDTALDVKLGLWLDNGILYIDISQHVADLDLAMYLGRERKQLAVYDFQNSQSIQL
tara:strand:- start:1715 stop:2077 length:363 start_codon:yes stop_codon:yes gene_type:complete